VGHVVVGHVSVGHVVVGQVDVGQVGGCWGHPGVAAVVPGQPPALGGADVTGPHDGGPSPPDATCRTVCAVTPSAQSRRTW
jgi:hypothetical protein